MELAESLPVNRSLSIGLFHLFLRCSFAPKTQPKQRKRKVPRPVPHFCPARPRFWNLAFNRVPAVLYSAAPVAHCGPCDSFLGLSFPSFSPHTSHTYSLLTTYAIPRTVATHPKLLNS